MFRNYLTVALRTLMRNKLYSLINVTGLAIGVSACLVIFLIIDHETGFDKFHPDGDRIYRVYSHFSDKDHVNLNRGVSTGVPAAARSEVSSIESVTGFELYRTRVSVGDNVFESEGNLAFAGEEFFDVFRSYEWLAGDPSVLSKPFMVVLREDRARKYFGVADPLISVGKEIHYSDSLVLTVAGILREDQRLSDLIITDFISAPTITASWLKKDHDPNVFGGTSSNYQMFVKLQPGSQPAEVESALSAAIGKHRKPDEGSNPTTVTLKLQPLSDLHFNAELGLVNTGRAAAHLPTLKILAGVALLILLIAAINFINLETAQAMRKSREVGIRKVLGSTRSRLIFHFLTHTAILTTIAVLIALPLSSFVLTYFHEFIPPGLSLQLGDPVTIAFLLVTLVVVSALAGFYPAFTLSSYLPVVALKSNSGMSGGQTRAGLVRRGLIVFQFTFAQALIIATIVVTGQIAYMLNKDLGFRKDAIVYVYVPWRSPGTSRDGFRNELNAIPEIKSISVCYSPPAMNGWSSSSFSYKTPEKEFTANVYHKHGDTAYLRVFGLELLAGRNLMPSDSIREFIINETLAKQFGFQNPQDAIGKMITNNNNKTYPVVGVVKDFHFQSLHHKIESVVIANEEKSFSCFGMQLTSKTGSETKSALEKIEKAYKNNFPAVKFNFAFLDETIANFYASDRRTSKLVATATAVAIFISCLGLFGLASFTTVQRTKEIGIRKVLGASVGNIVTLLSKEFIWLVLVAFVAAAPLAYYFACEWLARFPYRQEVGWLVFVLTILSSLLIAFLSVTYQSVKAALTDPVDTLRYE